MSKIIERITLDYNKILDYTLKNTLDDNRGIGLYTGVSGEILLLALDYLNTKNQDLLDKIHDLLDYCITYFSTTEYLNPTLSSGLAGFAWIVDYLVQNEIIDAESEEILESIDSFLIKGLDQLLLSNNSDLLNGAMGIGVYFIRRKNYVPAHLIINYLDEHKIQNKDELLWKVNKLNPSGRIVYDFSLAHGASGNLYFLSKCYSHKINEGKCLELINGILKFYENNVQNHEEIGSYFPNLIDVNDYFLEERVCVKSRLAWCYGDLGILYSILQSSILIGNKQLEKQTIERLLVTSKRRTEKETSVYDAGFCHGSTGSAFIYLELFLKTNIPEFEESSRFWLDRTLSYNTGSGSDPLSYGFFGDGNKELESCDNLLEGLTGVGITYNYFLNRKLSDFNDGLMLT